MDNDKNVFWIGLIKKSGGKLDVVERINEVTFGLIMVLTFTCTMNVATSGREEVGTVLWAALGCNVAWGIIDAFIYLFSVMMYRGESLDILRQVRNAKNNNEANGMIKDAMPPAIGNMMKPEYIDHLREGIRNLPEPPSKTIVTWNDFLGAIQIFFLVFISTFPVTIPFIFINDVYVATRISNSIALVSLFITGVYFGRKTRYNAVVAGFMLMGIGALLVAMTIALGG